MNGSPNAIRRGLFAHNVLSSFQSGINHGSVQVMRDQVVPNVPVYQNTFFPPNQPTAKRSSISKSAAACVTLPAMTC